MLPVYVEHEPVLTVLPGASTSGAAAGHARATAHRLENVLVASAILLGATDQAFVTIDAASPHLIFAPDPNDPSVRELRARAERDVPAPNDPSLRLLRDCILRDPPIPNVGA